MARANELNKKNAKEFAMNIRFTFICPVIAALVAQSASAEEAGFYFGGSAGSISSNAVVADLDIIKSSLLFTQGSSSFGGTSTMDDRATTWSLLGGYRFSSNFSIEGAYTDLGEFTYHYSGVFTSAFPARVPAAAGSAAGTSHIEWDNSAITLKLFGRLPVAKRFDVHAQIGAAQVMTHSTFSHLTPGRSGVINDDSSSTRLVYGVGGGFRLGERWTLSLDWQRYEAGKTSVHADVYKMLELNDIHYDAITLALLSRLGAKK